MAEALPVSFAARSETPRTHTLSTVRRLLLPAVGFATLGAGLVLLLVLSSSAVGYGPLALVTIGAGALIASVALDGRRPAVSPVATRDASPHERPAPAQEFPGRARPSDLAAGSDLPVVASGSEWRILSAPMDPGDETWLSWLPRESRRLGAVWSATAPRERYSPGGSGHLVAFPIAPPSTDPRPRHRELGDALPGPSVRRGHFTEEELDRMFPPVGRTTTVFLSEPPDRVGLTHSAAGSMDRPRGAEPESFVRVAATERPSPRTGRPETSWADIVATEEGSEPELPIFSDSSPSVQKPGLSSVPEASSSGVMLEASNPLPPHLRNSALLLRTGGPERRARQPGPSSQKSVCASCSKLVVNLRLSSTCPKCLRPVCDACLREAFASRGHGWCVDCSDSHDPISSETAA